MPDIYTPTKVEEGFESEPYYCSEHYPTIGYGLKIGPKHAPLDYYDFELSEAAAAADMAVKLDSLAERAKCIFSDGVFDSLTAPRQSIIVSMMYQLGLDGFKGFSNTIAAINRGDFEEAACEMLDSLWSRQTPERAERHSWQMRTGKWHRDYL